MNANCSLPEDNQPTRRGAIRRLSSALAWFLACVGLALAAALYSPAASQAGQSSAVKPLDFTTSR